MAATSEPRKVEIPRHFEAQGAGCGIWRFEPESIAASFWLLAVRLQA